ncbi:TRAP transporter small permease subunit [Notoacmeibacter sp. MSK16QG-6]|uniref:TRAP transporter small permease subunit n=1 Tax=Notoacmeibacter sp. MSK16QG-6 TaxID=2957982 RepID=UPI0020A17CEA|nr:TRAP transporter small permease [Notoacmeibacter sp. MSK16QG-6]MCP1200349.1 TRAP transporter small permease [Notoacmeibacter sp. MSK16QG-6]
MRLYISTVSAISRILGVIAGLFLLSAVLSVSHMVFVRYVLNQSTVWQTEYTTYAIVAATFLGAPWVLIVRGHVNVDVLQIAAPPRVHMVMEALSGLAALIFVGLMAYAAWYHFEEALRKGWRSDTVWSVPLWIPTLPMWVGLVWLAFQYVAELLRLATEGLPAKSGDETKLFDETAGSATQ